MFVLCDVEIESLSEYMLTVKYLDKQSFFIKYTFFFFFYFFTDYSAPYLHIPC